MVSLARTIRNFRRVGFKEWARQMLYIGDAKSGAFKGKDQYGLPDLLKSASLKRLDHV